MNPRSQVWFPRVARGISFIGPMLLLLIILATLVTRIFVPAGDKQGSRDDTLETGSRLSTVDTEQPLIPVNQDGATSGIAEFPRE